MFYKPLHQSVRKIQKKEFKIKNKIKQLEKEKKYLERQNETKKVNKLQEKINRLNNEQIEIVYNIPLNWKKENDQFNSLLLANKKATNKYRRNVDSVYENIRLIQLILEDEKKLKNIEGEIEKLKSLIFNQANDETIKRIKTVETKLNDIAGADLIKEKLSKARRNLKKEEVDINQVEILLDEANQIYILEKAWRKKANIELLPELRKFDDSIKNTIGLRLQQKLTKEQAKYVASCRAAHKDISLNF